MYSYTDAYFCHFSENIFHSLLGLETRLTHSSIIKCVNCVWRVFCMACNWVTHFILSNIGEMLLFIWLWLCWNESYFLSFTHTREDQYMIQHKQMWLNQLQQKSYY